MIHHESWYQEAVRPIQVDPGVLNRVVKHLWGSFLSYLDEREKADPRKGIPAGVHIETAFESVQNVRGERVQLAVKLIGKNFKDPIQVTGSLYRLTGPGEIHIYLTISQATPGAVKEALTHNLYGDVETQFWGVVQHEIVHAMDVINSLSYTPKGETQNKDLPANYWQKYYNDPAELRAYMSQIAQEVIMPDEGEPEGSFSNWLMAGIRESETWRKVSPYLTPASKKKLLQGVVQYLQDKGFSW